MKSLQIVLFSMMMLSSGQAFGMGGMQHIGEFLTNELALEAGLYYSVFSTGSKNRPKIYSFTARFKNKGITNVTLVYDKQTYVLTDTKRRVLKSKVGPLRSIPVKLSYLLPNKTKRSFTVLFRLSASQNYSNPFNVILQKGGEPTQRRLSQAKRKWARWRDSQKGYYQYTLHSRQEDGTVHQTRIVMHHYWHVAHKDFQVLKFTHTSRGVEKKVLRRPSNFGSVRDYTLDTLYEAVDKMIVHKRAKGENLIISYDADGMLRRACIKKSPQRGVPCLGIEKITVKRVIKKK